MLFIENKYTVLYFRIIEHAKLQVRDSYTEDHHIIPESLGGSSDPSNMVLLTVKEHWLVHKILTKITIGENKRKMLYAFGMFRVDKNGKRILTAKQYEQSRLAFIEAHSKRQVLDSTREKLREVNLALPKDHYCEHCATWFKKGSYRRWHGDLCKINPDIDPRILKERSEHAKNSITDEGRKRISESNSGESNGFYGKKHSDTTKQKWKTRVPWNKKPS